MASPYAESSPLISSDHVKAAVTEFGTIFISYFSSETNYGLISSNKIKFWIVLVGLSMQY